MGKALFLLTFFHFELDFFVNLQLKNNKNLTKSIT